MWNIFAGTIINLIIIIVSYSLVVYKLLRDMHHVNKTDLTSLARSIGKFTRRDIVYVLRGCSSIARSYLGPSQTPRLPPMIICDHLGNPLPPM